VIFAKRYLLFVTALVLCGRGVVYARRLRVLEIRRLRQAREWNQTELAYHAGLAPSVISQIENGKRDPSARTLRKLAEALEVEVGDLFPKAQSRSPLQASLTDAIEDLRRTAELYESLHAIQEAMDEYREVWERRLAEGDFDKTAFLEGGRALKAFWPAVTAAADAEVAVMVRREIEPEEAMAKGEAVLLPAIARFQALCDRVNSTYREKYAPGATVYAFPQREAS
jgi:transcriptional regulator with XRE-family HTH domain